MWMSIFVFLVTYLILIKWNEKEKSTRRHKEDTTRSAKIGKRYHVLEKVPNIKEMSPLSIDVDIGTEMITADRGATQPATLYINNLLSEQHESFILKEEQEWSSRRVTFLSWKGVI